MRSDSYRNSLLRTSFCFAKPQGPAGPASTLNQKSFSRGLRRKKHFECFAALAENLLNAAGCFGFMPELFSHPCPSLKRRSYGIPTLLAIATALAPLQRIYNLHSNGDRMASLHCLRLPLPLLRSSGSDSYRITTFTQIDQREIHECRKERKTMN
jgi:hypothetical protein